MALGSWQETGVKFQGPEGLSGILCKSGFILYPSQELQPSGACCARVCVCVCVCACMREREREREIVIEVGVYVYKCEQDQL